MSEAVEKAILEREKRRADERKKEAKAAKEAEKTEEAKG